MVIDRMQHSVHKNELPAIIRNGAERNAFDFLVVQNGIVHACIIRFLLVSL